MQKSIFEQIKKQNGEHFAKTIRGYHSGIFEIPHIVEILKYSGNDAEPLLPYLMSLKKFSIMEQTEYKEPLELLDEAGYFAYYVTNLKDQNAIQKYYRPDEELCTFYDPNRYIKCIIINAIKKNVRDFNRADFKGHEEREDDYATSVLSIQIPREGGRIRILNRYNHTVENSDNTFDGNPDKIIPGLAAALLQKFKIDFTVKEAKLPDGFVILDDKIFRYQTERGNTYIGQGYYVQNQTLHLLDPNTEIMLDHYVFNIQTGKLTNLFREYCMPDSFPAVFQSEIQGKTLQLTQNKDHGHTLWANGQPILTEKDGNIVSFTTQVKRLDGRAFMQYSQHLHTLNAPNLTNLPDGTLFENTDLEILNTPNLKEIGNSVLTHNTEMRTLNMPFVKTIGDSFLENNIFLYQFSAPNVVQIGDYFLNGNKFLRQLDFPNLIHVGSDFIPHNQILRLFNAPKLQDAYDSFLSKSILSLL